MSRSPVQWEDWQLNQLQSGVMNVAAEVPACHGAPGALQRTFFCLKEQGKPPLGETALDLEERVRFARPGEVS